MRHLTLGKEAALHHQFVIADATELLTLAQICKIYSVSYNGVHQRMHSLTPVFNLNLEASVPLTLAIYSSSLADYVDFQAKASQASFLQSLTLSMSSGQSSTDG